MEDEWQEAPLSPKSHQAPTENFDNGAIGSTTKATSIGKSKGKITKKMLLEELASVKSELASVRNENEQLLMATETNSANSRTCENLEVQQTISPGNGSILATMSNASLGSLNIPECKPSDGEKDVDKKAYEHWKKMLTAAFNLVRATDEHAKMDIFMIKAGPKLLELMEGTSSTADMPDESLYPFSNAIARLDNYFGSRTYIIVQRSNLMNTVQHSDESNITFVRRVIAAAKLCGYKKDEEMENVVRTIVKGTSDSRVRVLAQRNWVNQGDLNNLISMVRDREMELFNETEYQKLNRQNCASVAAVVESTNSRASVQRGTGFRFRGNQRGQGTGTNPREISEQGQAQTQGASQSACWRCASTYHPSSECPNRFKWCNNCNRRGHLARCCTTRRATAPRFRPGQKRPSEDRAEDEPRSKIAAIKQNGEENEDKVKEDPDVE